MYTLLYVISMLMIYVSNIIVTDAMLYQYFRLALSVLDLFLQYMYIKINLCFSSQRTLLESLHSKVDYNFIFISELIYWSTVSNKSLKS